MVSKVQKRPQTINGQIVQKTVDFDPSKITSAIYRAAYAVGGRDYDKAVELTKKVIERIEDNREYITVEEIQDIVEEVLVDNGHYKTAKAYILYRHQHAQARNADIVKSQEHILTYLSKNDLAVKENANMAFSLQGLNVFVAEQICENFWLEKIYPEFIRNAAISGDIHIHDLGILALIV